MSWLTRVSLRHRSVVALVVVAVLAFGVVAVMRLRQELMPSIEYPALTVFSSQPGASPADVERGVTIPLETSLKGLSGLKELYSYSNEGLSIIVALFGYGTDMTGAEAAAQQAVERARFTLPAGVQPEVQAINFGDVPVMQLAVTSTLSPEELGILLQRDVAPQLQQVPGVADVSLSGLQGAQVQVELDPLAMASAGVSIPAVLSTLSSANVSMPVGTVTAEGSVIPVRVTSETVDLAALEALPVTATSSAAGAVGAGSGMPGAVAGASGSALDAGGTSTFSAAGTAESNAGEPSSAKPVTLGQVATLEVVPTPVTSITRTNGEPSIGLAITKSSDGNVVEISSRVQELLPDLQASLGESIQIVAVVDQAPYITESISSMWREGLVGAVFAVLVILLFLRSWRSTVVAGLSIPLSVLAALIILWAGGNSLNILTLAGLTIAIGRVIDDSIVTLENSYRHLQEGDDVMSAALAGTKEVTAAVTASTLTTVAVFLPLGFVQGIASEFFRPFALTVTFALVASLIVSLTVVPVAVTWLLRKGAVGHREPDQITALQRSYLPALRWAIRHKAVTLFAAVAIFVGSLALVPLLKTNLLDHSQETTVNVTMQLPAGTETARTAEAAGEIEGLLADTEGVGIYQVTIGSTGGLFGPGGGTSASSSRAQFTVETDGTRPKADVIEDLRSGVAELQGVGDVTVTEGDSMGGDTSVIEVRVYSDDPAVLQQANSEVLTTLQTLSGLENVQSNLSESMPQIAVAVDPEKAAAAGLDATQVGQFVGLILHGMPAGTVSTQRGPLPAVVTLPSMTGSGNAVEQVQSLILAGARGIVPLTSIADVTEVAEPVQVTHTDGERTVTVSASATSGNVGQTSGEVRTALEGITLPQGARWEIAGATEQMSEMFTSLSMAMAAAILLVYVIMVGTFKSLLNPLILLVSIPFAAVGAIGLLLVTGTSLGMASLIGLLMLIGIVVTNAIVLLDLIEQFRERGMDAATAVIEGGRRRLRPILMTAVATILALTPMALGFGEGSFLSRPLAVGVIGGLLSSTLLTLIIVPVLYLSVEPLKRRSRHERADEGREDEDPSEVSVVGA